MIFVDGIGGFVVNPILADVVVVKAFMDSNLAGQVIVIVLAILSVVAWSVMLGKYFDLKALEESNRITENKLRDASSLVECAASRHLEGPYSEILKEAMAAWVRSGTGNSKEELSLRMGHVENAIQRALNRQSLRYESKMVPLGSIVSGAPFLGLLGTVWGVMESFGTVGMQASVTLQALAPGVSGALLTTVAGLVVAIPSVFGYNYLLATSRGLMTSMENFASSLADKIELDSRSEAIAEDRHETPAIQNVFQPSAEAEPRVRASVEESTDASSAKRIRFSIDDDDDDEAMKRDFE